MNIRLFFSAVALALSGAVFAQDPAEMRTIRLYDAVTFYDGYLMDKNPDKDLQDGVLRHSCSLYSVRLADEQLDQIGDILNMNVSVHACCDNYDRIGNINLAFVPKGAETYNTSDVDRVEIARFITPFMNKNRRINTVPYSYEMSYLSPILRDRDLRAKYDLWLEYELFGVPYAANKEIEGCEGRSDVFQGTLEFETSAAPASATEGNLLIPVVMKKPEYIGGNLNNYSEAGTDIIGKCVKTYTFEVPQDVTGGQIVLITSNHGANDGGEEYNRRWHYIYFDGENVLSYKPGRNSCEPFRKYNTQLNGIYGIGKKSDEEWQSFSNWCPGDVIDNRLIYLGDVKAGTHNIMISVPDAEFKDKQGDIPVSIYFHGATKGIGGAGIQVPDSARPRLSVNVSGGRLSVSSRNSILALELHTALGECLYARASADPINVGGLTPGIYLLTAHLSDGAVISRKVALP